MHCTLSPHVGEGVDIRQRRQPLLAQADERAAAAANDHQCMRQLTSLDAQFLAMENGRTQGHVSILGSVRRRHRVGRPLNAALVRELVTARMHLLPTFRWRLAPVPFGLDHPYWVDDGTFDVEYHVQDAALPAPGTQRQLADLVAHLIGRQLDRARPLWELYVIQGLEDGSVAVLTKMHHSAVDGVSGAEVMSVLLDDTATARDLSLAPAIAAERFPSEVEMLGRGLVGMWRQPLRALRAAPTTLPHLDDVADAPPRARGEGDRARAVDWSSAILPMRNADRPCRATTSSPPGPDFRPVYRRTAGSRSSRCRSTT